MQSLQIYFGDLTYDTVSLSTEAFPLNIAYIASYSMNRFGSNLDVKLFKYIEELDKAIHESPPDILALSNYCWNQRVGSELFRMLSKKNPNTLKVWGGPNFPLDFPSQEIFLEKHSEVDIYIPVEGEIGFSKIIERVLNEANSKEDVREKALAHPIAGCMSRDWNEKNQMTYSEERLTNLDEIPSPYLNGLLDKFFDGRLSPMISTNRGCPFTCSFCVDGTDLVRQVNQFSLERVNEELDYIAQHVPKNIHSMIITDLNFGMIPRDLETCKKINEIQQKYDYPHYITCTTGKNAKERVIEAIKNVNGALEFSVAVQSMDQQVLKNIRRSNISVEHMIDLTPALKEANIQSSSEVILGLPGETYSSHITTLRNLVNAQLDDIVVYSCMLLPGSELATPKERKKWGFKTKFRILPRDFAELSNGKKTIEIEEIVISSDTLSFDEYVELRSLAFSISVTNQGLVYDSIIKILRENDIDVFELFFQAIKKLDSAPMNIQHVFDEFKHATINELWDSPEDIEQYFQDESAYKKLLDEKAGINVMQYFHALVSAEYMEPWTDYVISIAYDLFKDSNKLTEQLKKQFIDISNYCSGLSNNTLGKDRMLKNPKFVFHYDVMKWLHDSNNLPLENFKFSSPSEIEFCLTDDQFKLVKDALDIYGHSTVGKAQILKIIPTKKRFRNPVSVTPIHSF